MAIVRLMQMVKVYSHQNKMFDPVLKELFGTADSVAVE